MRSFDHILLTLASVSAVVNAIPVAQDANSGALVARSDAVVNVGEPLHIAARAIDEPEQSWIEARADHDATKKTDDKKDKKKPKKGKEPKKGKKPPRDVAAADDIEAPAIEAREADPEAKKKDDKKKGDKDKGDKKKNDKDNDKHGKKTGSS